MQYEMTDSEREDFEQTVEECEKKIELLRRHELDDETAEELSGASQKDPRDRHERVSATILVDTDEETVRVGSIHRIAGNERVEWGDDVEVTFGVKSESAGRVQENYRHMKGESIAQLKKEKQRAERSLEKGVPWYV